MSFKFNDNLINVLEDAAKDGVSVSTEAVYTELRRLVLETPKTGRVRRHKITGGPHQASAPGEPYANETGEALSKTKTSSENGGLTGRISGGASYQPFLELELGTEKRAARPVFNPALKNKTPFFLETMIDKISKAIKK